MVFENISHLLCSDNAFEALNNFQLPNSISIHLKEVCNKIRIFCVPSQFWPLKIKTSLIFFHICIQNCEILKFKKIGLGPNVDIYLSNLFQKLSGTKIGLSFSESILTP